MKFSHIKFTDEGILLDDYFAYLSSVKERFTPELYAFAANQKHYNLTSHSSLHDSWLNFLNFQERATGERNETRDLEIDLQLLGAFHDRNINLKYKGVQSVSFDIPREFQNLPKYQVANGDLLMHEISINQYEEFEHKILFSRGSFLQISCFSIQHFESAIACPDKDKSDTD